LGDAVVAVIQARLKHQAHCAQNARDRLAGLCDPERIAQRYVELWSTLSG
jgi:hypothetical protein